MWDKLHCTSSGFILNLITKHWQFKQPDKAEIKLLKIKIFHNYMFSVDERITTIK